MSGNMHRIFLFCNRMYSFPRNSITISNAHSGSYWINVTSIRYSFSKFSEDCFLSASVYHTFNFYHLVSSREWHVHLIICILWPSSQDQWQASPQDCTRNALRNPKVLNVSERHPLTPQLAHFRTCLHCPYTVKVPAVPSKHCLLQAWLMLIEILLLWLWQHQWIVNFTVNK